MTPTLHDLFEQSSAAFPDRIAVVDPARRQTITYDRLNDLADALALDLTRLGAGAGHRVGIYAPKSIPAVAAILATLKAGGAYVPIDTTAPARRGVEILDDCGVSAIIVERGHASALCTAWGRELPLHEFRAASRLVELGCDLAILVCDGKDPFPIEGLAYVLYTSGSTGKSKGVIHTHASARCFIDWCSEELKPVPEDRFSSHAPFHFDLSILDLYVPFVHGAAVVLIGEEEGKNPLRLAPLIAETKVSVWYSTPSVLRLLLEHGGLERHEARNLRLVLFAGEVFAPAHLRKLQSAWPGRRYMNLYGPTETNVCTFYEIIGEVPPDRLEAYPIGKPITGDQTIVVDPNDHIVSPGVEGELLVHGGTVMVGYWNRPDLDQRAFFIDDSARRWYRTGDLVRENEDGDYIFLGRRDRMIKRRGYRVELGEIESALYRHPHVNEAAVVAAQDVGDGVRVRAFISWSDTEPPSTIALKRFCAENLPLYMVPDRFSFLNELPKTSTDKIDYVTLKSLDG